MWMEDSERDAIERAKAGDGEAFRLLVERHSRAVFRLAYRMTGNETDAEDVVQETFLRAYRQLDRFEERASFSTWLHRIAANYCLDLIRARKRHDELDLSATPQPTRTALEPVSWEPAADRHVFNTQIQQSVATAMEGLSPQERTAFVLRHFEGQSIEQISDVLGIGPSAAKNSIFRAVQKLRRALEPLVTPAR
jgi:RNA polymerase sigma-70 factor (ECF subfamily)